MNKAAEADRSVSDEEHKLLDYIKEQYGLNENDAA